MDYISVDEWIKEQSEQKKEGILIADRIENGNMLIKRGAIKGRGIVSGVKAMSIRDLAYSIAVEGFKKPVLIGQDATVAILTEIILCHGDEFSFIPKESICNEAVKDIYDKICQLRAAGAKNDDQGNKRITELFKLIEYFEAELERKEYFDECRALQVAIKKLKGNNENLSIARTKNLRTNKLQEEFLNSLGSVQLVSGDETDSKISSENVSFFKGYGIYNEVRYCLNESCEKDMRYGDTAIICAHPSYIPYIEAVLGAGDIPYTLSEGKSALHFKRIQMIDEALSFVEEGYRYEVLRPMFLDDALMMEGKTASFLASIKDNICLSREQSLAAIDSRIADYEEVKEGEDHYKSAQNKLAFLQLLKELISVFPESGVQVRPSELFNGVDGVIKNHLNRNTKRENKFARSAIDTIYEKIKYQGKMALCDAIKIIRTAISECSIGEPSKGDAVEIVTMGKVFRTDRKNLFFIGLSASSFIQDITQSPVLSDEELLRLVGDKAVLASKKGELFNEMFMDTLAGLGADRRIYFGTTTYNATTLYEESPAPIYYELMKEYSPDTTIENLPILEYEDIYSFLAQSDDDKDIPDVASAPEETCDTDDYEDEYDYLEDEDFDENDPDYDESEEDYYEDNYNDPEQDSVNAEVAAGEKTEPEKTAEFSPSAFQTLVRCPRAYYYKYIRRINEEDYTELSPDKWLTPSAKGNYFHYTLEEYCNEVLKDNDSVKNNYDKDAFDKAFANAEKKVIAECPYLSDAVRKKESEEVKSACVTYLKNLHKQLSTEQSSDKKWVVFGCEVSIEDMPHDDVILPAYFSFEDEGDYIKIKLKGKIDRLDHYFDKSGTEHFRIIDYKTGNIENFQKKLENEMQLQHVFYAKGVKCSSSENGKTTIVDDVQYVFPFDNKTLPETGTSLTLELSEEVKDRFVSAFANKRYQREYADNYLNYEDQESVCKYCSYGENGVCPEMVRSKR